MSETRPIATLPKKVNFIDVNHMTYGNFIGVLYVFTHALDEDRLRSAWDRLQEELPTLSGRYDRAKQSIVSKEKSALVAQNSGLKLEEFSARRNEQDLRAKFINEPDRKSVLAGRAPLASLTLTRLNELGSVMGLAINHVITDAGGFHKIAARLSEIYSYPAHDRPDPFITDLAAFEFGTSRDWPNTKKELTKQGLKPPAPMTGVKGFLPYNLILWSMKKITAQQRLHIHLSADQVQKLKATALEESGEDWISTNAALCAHFAAIMIQLIHKGSPEKSIRMGQLLDLRSRYFDDPSNLQNRFIGNAILIHTELAQLEHYDRGSLTRFFKTMAGGLTPEFVRSRLDVISDSLRHGRTYPGLEMSTPLLAVNNQTKMPVYDIDFDDVKPIQVIPQDVGDNIMFFPASDGGVDVFIRDILNPKRQAKLDTPEWQARIFDF